MKFIGQKIVLAWLAIFVPSAIAGGWDKVAAAKYLDDRMDMWFEKADKLRTGDGSTSCISCHTVVPYAMARPVLRKSLGEHKPTPQETRLFEEIFRRVDTYASHEQFYESNAEESRGVEAVVNLLILAGDDARQNRREASEPTRKALQEFWKQQRPDGAWNWFDFANEPWESLDSVYYGAALAAIAVGSVPGYARSGDQSSANHVASLRNYLIREFPRQNLYNQAWMLMASTHLDGLLTPAGSAALAAKLLDKQNADGGWSLYALASWTWSKASPPFESKGKTDPSLLYRSDGYATGFLTYALRESGLPAKHPALKRAAVWLRANQRECQIDQHHWKCWRTFSLNYDREQGDGHGEPWRRMFMSDAATAFAALALLDSD